MLRLNLFELLKDDDNVLRFLKHNNLIATTYVCPGCGQEKNIENLNNKRCNTRIGGNKCFSEISIFNNTLFENSKLSPKIVLFLLYEWCEDTPTIKTAKEYSCNQSTVSRWYSKFQEFAVNAYETFETEKIGGPNQIVQINETCILKRKSHQGRILRYQKWIFGGVELENNNKFFFKIVENRSSNILLNLINENIASGSIIMSDMWRGYNNLETLLAENNYTHLQVNHSQNFINPLTGAHTQAIEAFWSVMKRKLRRLGTNYGDLRNVEKKLIANLFKKIHNNSIFEIMLIIIALIYEN